MYVKKLTEKKVNEEVHHALSNLFKFSFSIFIIFSFKNENFLKRFIKNNN